MNICIIIPSYWDRKAREASKPDDLIYDHPTALDEEGTLARAIKSFDILNNRDFTLVVMGSGTNPDLEKKVESKVKSIVKECKSKFKILPVSHSHEKKIKKYLKSKGNNELADLVSLYGYSNIRNMCLLSAVILDCEVAILFDDDEVMEDANYISKATEYIGRNYHSKFIGGIAGYYLRPEGGYLIPDLKIWWLSPWNGTSAMNNAFRKIIATPSRLKETPFVFGGNMVIHKKLFTQVPFDPMVTRGEDIDYLINSRMFGFPFFLDNKLAIRHLQPKAKKRPDWLGFRQNVVRFSYERKKLLSQRKTKGIHLVRVESLDPYPGKFLKEDLYERIFKTSVLLGLKYLSEGKNKDFLESMQNIEIARRIEEAEFNPFEYLRVAQKKWIKLCSLLKGRKELIS